MTLDPRTVRYAQDPEYRSTVRAAQAERYRNDPQVRAAAIARAKARRQKQVQAGAASTPWKTSEQYQLERAAKRQARARKSLASVVAWARENPERVRTARQAYLAANPGLQAHYGRWSECLKRKAIPAWANKGSVEQAYRVAALLRLVTGVEYQVDHIVPLRHPLVCGFHCEANLRVVPLRTNLTKSNRYWPDMPE